MEVLNQIILNQTESKFETLDELKKIVMRYGLYSTKDAIPNKISELKNKIKNELFVNIYDFVVENKTQFDDIYELSEYTFQNNLFFPRDIAKEKFIYKVLLKQLKF